MSSTTCRRLLLLLLLLWVCLPTISEGGGKKKAQFVLGQGNCPGEPLVLMEKATIITCQRTCILDLECLTFSFNMRTKQCATFSKYESCIDRDTSDGFSTYRLINRRLFSIVSSPRPDFSWYRVNFGKANGGLQSGMCIMPYHKMPDGHIEFDGFEINRVQNGEILEPECAGLCAADSNCLAFTYGVIIPDVLIKCVLFDSKCAGISRNPGFGEDLLNSAIRL
jgi:hypothetical protein